MSTPSDVPPTPMPSPHQDGDSWDNVDQGSWESFPASDPPSWGSSHAAPTKRTMSDANREVVDRCLGVQRRRRRVLYGAIAGGGLALGGLVIFAARYFRR